MTEFRCPKWDAGTCDCPDGTVRPDCPGLRAMEGEPWTPSPPADQSDGTAIATLIIIAAMLICMMAGIAIGRLC